MTPPGTAALFWRKNMVFRSSLRIFLSADFARSPRSARGDMPAVLVQNQLLIRRPHPEEVVQIWQEKK